MNQPTRSTLLPAYLALLAGILSTGFSGIFVFWANAPGPVTGFYRMAIATLAMAIPFWRQARRQRAPRPGTIPLTPYPHRALLLAVLGGALFASDLVFWNSGVLLSGATMPTLMGNTAPVWVGLGALVFFREKLTLSFWLGLLLAISGAVVILGLNLRQDFNLGLGTLLGLLSGIFYGGYYLVTQRGRQFLDTITYFWLATAIAVVVLFLLTQLLSQPLTGYPRQSYLSFLGLGLLVHAFGQYSFSYALGYLPASLVAPAGLGQPVVTALLAGPLLGQYLTPGQAAGGVAVLVGVLVVHRSRTGRRSA